jgi:hypothetical protein
MLATPDPSREVVHPFLSRSGLHVLRMQPLGAQHYSHSTLPHDCAKLLEPKATQVEENIFRLPTSDNVEMCFLIMMAWYLVVDSASLASFVRTKPLSRRLWFVDADVWAVVVTFRNFHVLRDHMSSGATSRYMDCFDRLVSVLEDHGCIVHSSYTPID